MSWNPKPHRQDGSRVSGLLGSVPLSRCQWEVLFTWHLEKLTSFLKEVICSHWQMETLEYYIKLFRYCGLWKCCTGNNYCRRLLSEHWTLLSPVNSQFLRGACLQGYGMPLILCGHFSKCRARLPRCSVWWSFSFSKICMQTLWTFFFHYTHTLFQKEDSNNPTCPPLPLACQFCENILVCVSMVEASHFQKEIQP